MNKQLILAGLIALIGFSCGGNKSDDTAEKAAPETSQPAETKGENVATTEGTKADIAKTLGVDMAKMQRDESGLEYIVTAEGDGAVPTKGQTISAHYTGYLLNGTKFDSSVDRGQPFETQIGVGRVIQGWDLAFTDMKVGEKRVLFIPSELGYGDRGAGGVIPPNATLVFDVQLLDIVQ